MKPRKTRKTIMLKAHIERISAAISRLERLCVEVAYIPPHEFDNKIKMTTKDLITIKK